MSKTSPLEELARRVQLAARTVHFVMPVGEIKSIGASTIVVAGLSKHLRLGSLVEIEGDERNCLAAVIKVDRDRVWCKPLDVNVSISLSDAVLPTGDLHFYPDPSWRGRIIDALGRPMDGGPTLGLGLTAVGLYGSPPPAMSRQLIGRAVKTGVRAIDAFVPLCLGQRIGIFAGSGVGKSTLLSMIARAASFDRIIVSLVGERGREVREFVENTLGPSAKSALTVVATGDESAMMRRMAPLLSMSLAEYFRDCGEHVLLIVDSITRYAHACREVALSAGEPPVARGYPPSVFTSLPQFLERAGPGSDGTGTITALFAVLVDGDDHNDPVADAIRGTLDGHIVLDRAIAEQGRYPAVDLLASLSRLSHKVWAGDQAKAVAELKKLVARFEDTRDLRAMGGYVRGGDADLDRAIDVVPRLYSALSQGLSDPPSADSFREIAEALSLRSG